MAANKMTVADYNALLDSILAARRLAYKTLSVNTIAALHSAEAHVCRDAVEHDGYACNFVDDHYVVSERGAGDGN